MPRERSQTLRRGFMANRIVIAAAAVTSVGIGIAVWLYLHTKNSAIESAHAPTRVAVPWRNVDPAVKYVGDAACAECHRSKCDSYHRHPMGRSSALVDAGIGSQAGATFSASSLQYAVERRGDRMFHKETCRDKDGKTLYVQEAEVKYVVGSGRQGKTYLIDRDGFLFQSPIGWYTNSETWG